MATKESLYVEWADAEPRIRAEMLKQAAARGIGHEAATQYIEMMMYVVLTEFIDKR